MPEMDGFEVCQRLKEDEAHPGYPHHLCEARCRMWRTRSAVSRLGAWILSPNRIEELEVLARVKTHLQLRKMQLHLEELVAERTAELVQANEALKAEIAERKRVEQKLRVSEERFRATFEQAAVGISPRVVRWSFPAPQPEVLRYRGLYTRGNAGANFPGYHPSR